MAINTSAYNLSINQCADFIATMGPIDEFGEGGISTLVSGEMGGGKTSILHILTDMFPDHHPCYFDGTTKDMGDMFIPNFRSMETGECVTFVPNEEFGIHLGKPVILMVDEIGKALPPVQQALTRTLQERYVGNQPLHPASIIFATTNLTAENVGDIMKDHANNRITRLVMRKSTNLEWIENFGIPKKLDHAMLGWVKDTPQTFQSFTEVEDPSDNPYIFHPKEKRTSFVTGRSLHKASNILKRRHLLDSQTVQAALIGTIGARAAADLMAYVRLADQIPSLDDIKNDPENAVIPTSSSATCMVVYRTLATIESGWVTDWMKYLSRLDREAQGLFANSVRNEKYKNRSMVMTNKLFTEWALNNNYLFAADLK